MLNMESYRNIIDGEGRMQWGSKDQTSRGLLKPPRYKILKKCQNTEMFHSMNSESD